MPSPNQRGYSAHQKYAMIAEMLGLGGQAVDEKVAKLIEAVNELLDRLAIPRSIAELGILKGDFELALPDLAGNAFGDPSWLSNPRMPLMSELVELFWSAYHGRGGTKKGTESVFPNGSREEEHSHAS
jgi:acetaldehyde dehydrogenase/alcohol dehydrogenase